MPHDTNISNPCQSKALSLLERERLKVWIMAIETMERTLSPKSKKYLELRREAEYQQKDKSKRGPAGWVEYVQPRYAALFYSQNDNKSVVHEKTMEKWMNNIVTSTIIIRYEILLNNLDTLK